MISFLLKEIVPQDATNAFLMKVAFAFEKNNVEKPLEIVNNKHNLVCILLAFFFFLIG